MSSSFRIALDNYLAELDVAADTVIDVGEANYLFLSESKAGLCRSIISATWSSHT